MAIRCPSGAAPRRAPKASAARNTSENIAMFSSTSGSASRPLEGGAVLCGKARCASTSTPMPSGSWIRNNQGHDATDSTRAAMLGPATDAVATTTELSAMPRPSTFDG